MTNPADWLYEEGAFEGCEPMVDDVKTLTEAARRVVECESRGRWNDDILVPKKLIQSLRAALPGEDDYKGLAMERKIESWELFMELQDTKDLVSVLLGECNESGLASLLQCFERWMKRHKEPQPAAPEVTREEVEAALKNHLSLCPDCDDIRFFRSWLALETDYTASQAALTETQEELVRLRDVAEAADDYCNDRGPPGGFNRLRDALRRWKGAE